MRRTAPTPSGPVVLVHGLWMTGVEACLLARRLRACGFEVVRFRYRSLTIPPRENALRLREFVAALPGDVVHFVGHSLGGLVIAWMLHDSPSPRHGRVVMMGTPWRGSRVAARLAAARRMRWLVGRATERGLLGDGPPWGGAGRELGVIAGTVPFGPGRLFTRLPRPHDGTVAVDETRVPGMTDFVAVRASHFGLLLSAVAARHACEFLRRGRFAGGEGGAV